MENNNVDTTKTINHLSLCSGYEGIGLGLRRVLPNLREIAYVEREGFPVANLVAKMEAGELDAAPVFTDVKTFPYGKFRGCVDILSGGFPCQPFSSAGKRQAAEDPRHLFPYIADGIRECQPRIVFLENVEGIISAKTADGESVLQYVLRELEGLGYRATAGVFSAAEVGAPHQRKRVFILGYASSIRSREHRADTREVSSDQSGEERRVYEPQGASRPIDVPSIQGCTEGRQIRRTGQPATYRVRIGGHREVPTVPSEQGETSGPMHYLEDNGSAHELAHDQSRTPGIASRKGGKSRGTQSEITGPPDQRTKTTGKSQESRMTAKSRKFIQIPGES